jgi:hypothetical protein
LAKINNKEFNIDEIIASRANKKLEKSPKSNFLDPFSKIGRSKQKQQLLKSYKDAREEKHKQSLQNNITSKIQNYDNETIEKLADLMNMLNIGDSMPIDGDLQQIPEVNEPDVNNNFPDYPQKEIEDFELSRGTINDNPFTKESNFLAYHATVQGKADDFAYNSD